MSSLNKASIKEANDHLKQLHRTVFELENEVQMQVMHIEELSRTNRELHQKLLTSDRERDGVLREKDKHISHLERKVRETEQLCQKLLEAAQERDAAVLRLERKARLFYEVIQHKSALERIVLVLNELSHEGGGTDAIDINPNTVVPPQGLEVLGEKLARIRLPSSDSRSSSLGQLSPGTPIIAEDDHTSTPDRTDSTSSEHS